MGTLKEAKLQNSTAKATKTRPRVEIAAVVIRHAEEHDGRRDGAGIVVAVGVCAGTVDLAKQEDSKGFRGDGCNTGLVAGPPEVLGKSVARGKASGGGEAEGCGTVEALNAELQPADMATVGRGDSAGSVVSVRRRVDDNAGGNGNGDG